MFNIYCNVLTCSSMSSPSRTALCFGVGYSAGASSLTLSTMSGYAETKNISPSKSPPPICARIGKKLLSRFFIRCETWVFSRFPNMVMDCTYRVSNWSLALDGKHNDVLEVIQFGTLNGLQYSHIWYVIVSDASGDTDIFENDGDSMDRLMTFFNFWFNHYWASIWLTS